MSEPEPADAAAWREGVSPDDHARISELGPLFAALAQLAVGAPVELPPVPEGAAERVVHAALAIRLGVVARDRSSIERGVDDLAQALAELPDDDPHAAAARAWADLALGQLALLLGDLRVAQHRFQAVAVPAASPIALRIDAMEALIELAVERRDLEAARGWSDKAVALCERCDRPIQAARVRRHALVLGYALGDVVAAEAAISELAASDPAIARLGRLLVATGENDSGVSAVLDDAIRTGDSLLFALAILVGLRRHLAADRLDAATELVEAGVGYLRHTAPHLVPIFEQTLS